MLLGLECGGAAMSRVDYYSKVQRNKYWRFLREVQAEFVKLTWKTEHDTQADFENYLQQNYGVAPIMTEGQYSASFNIVNENKFLLTRIKYDI